MMRAESRLRIVNAGMDRTMEDMDPDRVVLAALHEAQRSGMRTWVADGRGRKLMVVLPAGPLLARPAAQ